MSDKILDLNQSPETGMKVTADFLKESAPEIPAVLEKPDISEIPPVDSKGTVFDSAIHKLDHSGEPVTGSKGQFLLKPEAKKSVFKKIRERATDFWNGKEREIPAAEKSDVPLSDHELPPESAEFQPEKPEISGKIGKTGISASAENSAELFFLGGSVILGVEFLNQRRNFHPQVAELITDYERRTGKEIDLPPGVALSLGLGRIAYEIAQREPACKARFDAGAKVIRNNAMKYVGRKLPFFKNREHSSEESGGGND
ncbi:MAG: hypothetical protein WC959_07595 [Kiritimatiellales bacterium]